ncbi:hypothetical protein EZV62_022630 [Acer yangbiense]|uniref:Uncharacterized protein n=1 Tax=Acer yangbiense TaxID=1000413 RepID=A0A5C7H938_9ROSI|nr:hypothetical protein EZV62_022630 [Acer yangbiense]
MSKDMIPYTNPDSICVELLMELTNKPKKPAGSYFLFCKEEWPGFVGGVARHQQLRHCCSDVCEMEAMEAYKKELEEYKNSIAAATDDNQQLQKKLVEEEEDHTTNNTIVGAKDAKPKKNKSKCVKDC